MAYSTHLIYRTTDFITNFVKKIFPLSLKMSLSNTSLRAWAIRDETRSAYIMNLVQRADIELPRNIPKEYAHNSTSEDSTMASSVPFCEHEFISQKFSQYTVKIQDSFSQIQNIELLSRCRSDSEISLLSECFDSLSQTQHIDFHETFVSNSYSPICSDSQISVPKEYIPLQQKFRQYTADCKAQMKLLQDFITKLISEKYVLIRKMIEMQDGNDQEDIRKNCNIFDTALHECYDEIITLIGRYNSVRDTYLRTVQNTVSSQ